MQTPQNGTVAGAGRFGVIPISVRLDAHPDYTGKGITIALLDSGFYRHPDLAEPENRIVEFVDICKRRASLTAHGAPRPWDWHGTQTSVVAAGNGFMSSGQYSSLAPDARVVLVKVGSDGRIREEDITRGLEWVMAHQERLNIRVVSISLGGDDDSSYLESPADQAAEEAIRRGIVVVAAAGNTGCTPMHHTRPPANSPNVITVGGYDDNNQLGEEEPGTYCSSFGVTRDGIVKPDVIAPAIWVAAPILPDSPESERAEDLCLLASQPDYVLDALCRTDWKDNSRIEASVRSAFSRRSAEIALSAEASEPLRDLIEAQLRDRKIIAPSYMHVDGTSFAAPIVSSVVAQMLEANPKLAPRAVKYALTSSAFRISEAPLLWQGYGMVRPRRAVELALEMEHGSRESYFHPPRMEGDSMLFYYHNPGAERVSLVGDFNSWNVDANPMNKDRNEVWIVRMACPPPGRYGYKFLVGGSQWIEDPSNGLKDEDGHGGFNSVLNIGKAADQASLPAVRRRSRAPA